MYFYLSELYFMKIIIENNKTYMNLSLIILNDLCIEYSHLSYFKINNFVNIILKFEVINNILF